MNITDNIHSGSGSRAPLQETSGAPLIGRLMEWAHVLIWTPVEEKNPPVPQARHLRTERSTERHGQRIGGQGFASLCRDGLSDQRLQTPRRRLRGAAIDDADLNTAEIILRAPHVPVLKDF